MTSLPSEMTAIEIAAPGGPEKLRLTTRPLPACGPGEVLVRVAAAGVNRPDVMQRQGRYAPPPGTSDLRGLEIAGEIAAVGPGVSALGVGDPGTALTLAPALLAVGFRVARGLRVPVRFRVPIGLRVP